MPNAYEVNVVPQPKAGGSFGTTAYNTFKDPIAIEEIQARVIAARSRAKFIGGGRAHYNEDLM